MDCCTNFNEIKGKETDIISIYIYTHNCITIYIYIRTDTHIYNIHISLEVPQSWVDEEICYNTRTHASGHGIST